jgi:protocatechuate 3,4-dioxygenase beta subunit
MPFSIAPLQEEGMRLVISGIVYEKDGKTPAKDVIIYVYHTNNQGLYPKKGDEQGNGKRHGYLRGWMKTDARGRYRFNTIKPAPYQTHGGEPAHIHYTVKAPGKDEYWLTGLWFSDDSRVTQDLVENVPRDGGFGNVTDLRMENGIWKGSRDIRLMNY